MSRSRTETALVARGLDSAFAASLVARGLTLAALKIKPEAALRSLGFSSEQIRRLREIDRPPIPNGTVIHLLYESRRTCCLCRDASRSVVVHHIVPWAESRSHPAGNLVVLCLQHHDEAHATRRLSRTLARDEISHAKAQWLAKVASLDTAAALEDVNILGMAAWDYFNHRRLVELAAHAGVDLSSITEYRRARREDLIHEDGAPGWLDVRDKIFMYEGGIARGSSLVYSFYKALLRATLEKNPAADLSSARSRALVRSIAQPGALVHCRGAFYSSGIILWPCTDRAR